MLDADGGCDSAVTARDRSAWKKFHEYLTTLSLRFNGHFPGEPGLAGAFLKQRMMELAVTATAISRAKLQSCHHHQQTNTQHFTGRMPFLSPNQQ